MLYFILGIVILVVIKFWNDKEKEVSKVNAQGGMMNKYRELISYFREIPNSQIQQVSSSSVKVVIRDKFVVTTFTINHGFSDYTIFWNHQSYTFGNHQLHWTFPEYMDQLSAINAISRELDIYQNNVLKKYL